MYKGKGRPTTVKFFSSGIVLVTGILSPCQFSVYENLASEIACEATPFSDLPSLLFMFLSFSLRGSRDPEAVRHWETSMQNMS
jgi:hypothetical protein